ncbi:MAG: hypothetical protein ABIQ77_01490 [Anaerolineales bacterium]
MVTDDPQKTNSEIRKLEDRLSILAMTWRGEPHNREMIKREYHETMAILFSLGWDDFLDIDCELPDEDMPQEYKSRHPSTKTNSIGSFSWHRK